VEAVELAASAGLLLDEWEQQVLIDSLGERDDGKWAAFEVGLVVPRQNGKGAILEAREIAGLFLFGENLILHSAHEFKTASEAFRRVWALVQGCPDLEKRVLRVRTSHGDEGIELRTGQRLRFVARSTGSGRGFSGDTVILDEAYNLSERAMAALLPTMAARPNPQLWYTSSAPLPVVESEVLRRMCRRGRAGESEALAYTEFCAAGVEDLDDREAWADANPALGIRISEEFIEREREALEDDAFARERLGVWTDLNSKPRVIPLDAWEACSHPKSIIEGAVSFALDVTPGRSAASIGAAGRTAAGKLHIEVIDHHRGTAWVVKRAAELAGKWGGKVVVDATGPAGALLNDLESAGVEVQTVNSREHSQACGALFDAITELVAVHIDQPDLNVAVDGADRRPMGDAWLWSRRLSAVDISPLVAVTLAAWAASQSGDGPSVYEDREMVVL
jgi:phage terminase large subunit-like protein